MPKLTPLTQEEFNATMKVAKRGPKKLSKREKTNRKYMRMLAPFENGGFAEVKLAKGENRQTVKNRLKRAADEMGIKLDFKRTRGSIRFEVKK